MIFDSVSRHKSGILSLASFKTAIGKSNISSSKIVDESHIIFGKRFPTLKKTTELVIEEALKRSKGNQAIAAGLLGISPAALSKRLIRERDKYQ